MPRKPLNIEQLYHRRSVLEYLQSATPAMLREVQLNRLNHITNMWREIRSLLEQINQEQSEANIAQFYLDGRSFDRPRIKTVSSASGLFSEAMEETPKLLTQRQGQDRIKSRVRPALHSHSARR